MDNGYYIPGLWFQNVSRLKPLGNDNLSGNYTKFGYFAGYVERKLKTKEDGLLSE